MDIAQDTNAALPTWRLRVELDDHPGALAKLTASLAAKDCNILALTVLPVPDGVVDDLIVRTPLDLRPAELVTLVRAVGGRCAGITQADLHDLSDAPTAALRAVTALAGHSATYAEAVRDLLGADSAEPADTAPHRPGPHPIGPTVRGSGRTLPDANRVRSAPTEGDPAASSTTPADPATATSPASTSPPDTSTAGKRPTVSTAAAASAPAGTSPTTDPDRPVDRPAVDSRTTDSPTTDTDAGVPDAGIGHSTIGGPGGTSSADLAETAPELASGIGARQVVLRTPDGTELVVRRGWAAFTEVELSRSAALADLATVVGTPTGGPVAVLTSDGAGVVLRSGRPGDSDAVAAMHDRCSRATLFARYHAGTRSVPRRLLNRLLTPPRGQTIVAVLGHQVIALGQLISTVDPAVAEVSLLVEDDWQSRGIGTALLKHLVRTARAAGHAELVGWCLPSECGLLHTAARGGVPSSTTIEDGALRISLDTHTVTQASIHTS